VREWTQGGYTLRNATDADAEYLYALDEATMRAYVVAMYGAWDEALVRARVTERIALGSQIVLVDGADAGMLELRERDGEVVLVNIRVAPRLQRRGLGAAIIRDVVAAAHADGKGVSLRALNSNPAIGLYHRLGFDATSVDEAHRYQTSPRLWVHILAEFVKNRVLW
jgi:ribosomal protein S18 acetylase RimI-like enzyme